MKNTPTRPYGLLATLALLMSVVSAEAQTAPEVPRLVVNVIIDQLRSDYLEAFSPLYGDRGFQRLMQQGRVYTQAQYPFACPDRASAIATLMSGTVPYEHGIVAQRWLDRQSLQPVFCVDDQQYPGTQPGEFTSPQHLGVSTFTDELKVSTEGKALVYSIAPERDAAVFAAGHAADGCFWLSDASARWATSSYYGTAPAWLSYYDDSHQLSQRLGSTTWEPCNALVGEFNYFVGGRTHKPFKHTFKGDRRVREFKASGLVNEEVTNFVDHCLRNTMMGIDPVPDVLSVTYYAGNYDHLAVSDYPMELQDTYVRLDYQLGRLIDIVEQKVGRDRVMFVLTGTGYCDTEQTDADLSRYRIPTGEFNISRAQLLLNMYLIAVYGQGQYVETSMGNQMYLNLKFIENKGLNLTEVLERSADFLIQLSGVRDVYTSQRLMLGAWTPGIRDIRNAYNPRCSGDILVQVAPGWRLVNENTNENLPQRESYMGFPLCFYGADVSSEVVRTPVAVDCVAPTVAQHLRIRAPNSCSVAPLVIRK
ncbi:MAG: alkaline phosphatase family protein [Bacteroidaceae bacterium]|nr:alkaline phosphatase family protein [Bacteroidaceae bacterium]